MLLQRCVWWGRRTNEQKKERNEQTQNPKRTHLLETKHNNALQGFSPDTDEWGFSEGVPVAPAVFPGRAAYAGAADGGFYDANTQRRYYGTPGEGALLSFPYPYARPGAGDAAVTTAGNSGSFEEATSKATAPAAATAASSTNGRKLFPAAPVEGSDASTVDDAILRSGGGVGGESTA